MIARSGSTAGGSPRRANPPSAAWILELSRLYDLQNSPEYRDEMTCIDPDTGQRISVSWLFPRSAEDLKKKRRKSQLWNELSWVSPIAMHPGEGRLTKPLRTLRSGDGAGSPCPIPTVR